MDTGELRRLLAEWIAYESKRRGYALPSEAYLYPKAFIDWIGTQNAKPAPPECVGAGLTGTRLDK